MNPPLRPILYLGPIEGIPASLSFKKHLTTRCNLGQAYHRAVHLYIFVLVWFL